MTANLRFPLYFSRTFLGVVLFPGGTLPAIFHEAHERASVQTALSAPRPTRNLIVRSRAPIAEAENASQRLLRCAESVQEAPRS